MGAELNYQAETTETRVSSLLNKLANGFEEEADRESSWRSETEPGWDDNAKAENSSAPKTWQVLNSSPTHNSAWASPGDGVLVKWAHVDNATTSEPKRVTPHFRPNPKLMPGVGQDLFRSTQEREADWQAALAGEGAFATATTEKMGAALDDLVSSRLGSGLQESIELLEAALGRSALGVLELPQGAAVVDVVWELHGELEWNGSFKTALLEHLELPASASKKELLDTLVAKLITRSQGNKRLRWLQEKFQKLVQQALDKDLEIEACEREIDDPFARLLTKLGVITPKRCHQDIICQSLDAIGC